MRNFVLIDGNAIVHRAFHALPPLTNSKGELTNAVYGFFSMLLKILEDVRPKYLAICFDRPKPTFRKELYVGYQAKRPKMDEGLSSQMKILHDVLEEIGIPIFEVDGYEADDLIGTLAKQAVSKQTTDYRLQRKKTAVDCRQLTVDEVIIVSGDRDMLQLVNSHVKVLAPITGITKMILFDSKLVEEKYGVKPTQIIDSKALTGDASDNYPGVAGVGPKTAKDLLLKYGSLENLYGSVSEVEKENPKLALRLADGAESAGLAKKLATIITDAPITLDIDCCVMEKIKPKKFRKAFEDLGFKSLAKRVPEKWVETPLRQGSAGQEKEEQLGLL